jgi:hypothetical protein
MIRNPARVTRGGLNAGDLSAAEGTGMSLVMIRMPATSQLKAAQKGRASCIATIMDRIGRDGNAIVLLIVDEYAKHDRPWPRL